MIITNMRSYPEMYPDGASLETLYKELAKTPVVDPKIRAQALRLNRESVRKMINDGWIEKATRERYFFNVSREELDKFLGPC
jgi:HEPN domain-containing protein